MRRPGGPRRLSAVVAALCAGFHGGGCAEREPDPAGPSRVLASDLPEAVQWFTDVTAEVGLDFTYQTGATGQLLMPEIMGSGAALFDADNDGDLDIYLSNGGANRLYRQEPDGRFVDVTEQSGLGDRGYGMGMAVGDFDNDGFDDVYVTNYGPDHLYHNTGDGRFEDVTGAAGIRVDGWSSSAAFVDFDLDGYLDLYVARYVDFDPQEKCFSSDGRPEYCGPKAFPPVSDVLLHNNGDGTFSDVSEQAGMTAIAAAGLGVISEDLNDDGLPDLYVANDAYANQLWINRGDGTFRDDAMLMGVAFNMHGQAEAGMGVIAADFDLDGDADLFMTHLAVETNTLYRNLGGDRGFRDVTGESGLGASSMPFTGFGTVALDVDFDGDPDLVVVNGKVKAGAVHPGCAMSPPWDRYAEPNLFYRNDGNGLLEVLDGPVSSLCGTIEISRGLAAGDIDGDGDLDLLISNVEGPARLYRNDAPRHGAWVAVRAVDPRYRHDAIGAQVAVVCGPNRYVRTISSGFSYQSSSPARAHFGLGPAEEIDRIEVRWPDGLRERYARVEINAAVTLTRGGGEPIR